MRFGRLNIGFWTWTKPEEKKFIWFEYLNPGCGCKILTIFNICIEYIGNECYSSGYEG